MTVQQAHRKRNMQGQLVGLAWRCRCSLTHAQLANARRCIDADRHRDTRGARLGVPARELGQIQCVGVSDRRHEVVTGDGLTIMSGEVQVHAFAESFAPGKRLQHPNDFRAFLVDRERVEVIDLLIGVRANRMRHRTSIFRKL